MKWVDKVADRGVGFLFLGTILTLVLFALGQDSPVFANLAGAACVVLCVLAPVVLLIKAVYRDIRWSSVSDEPAHAPVEHKVVPPHNGAPLVADESEEADELDDSDNPKWVAWLVARGPGLFLKGLLVTLALFVFGHFVAPVFLQLGGLLCAFLIIFGALLINLGLGNPDRHRSAAADELAAARPDPRAGRRKWKADVYDENAYAILDVPQNASREDIRSAYKKLAQRYHPDAVPLLEKERAALVFMRLNQAFDLLTHARNRARYDAWIEYLDGGEPMLDDACALFENEEQVAEFDEKFNLKPPAEERAAAPPEPEQATPTAAPTAQDAPPPVAKEPPAPMEVDMPEAVREALGLPPRPPQA